MKKLIFLNCILAVAVIFSFCAKTDPVEELAAVNNPGAADRGNCVLSQVGVSNTAILTICGTNTNTTNCIDCTNQNAATGVEVRSIAGLNLALVSPITISVTPDRLTVMNFTAGGNSTGAIQVPAGVCRRFFIDNNCNITAL